MFYITCVAGLLIGLVMALTAEIGQHLVLSLVGLTVLVTSGIVTVTGLLVEIRDAVKHDPFRL